MARRKKEVVEEVYKRNRFKIPHDAAMVLWNRVLIDAAKTGIGDFLISMGFYTPSTLEECSEVGGFLICFTDLFPEKKVRRSFFSWIRDSMGSILIGWGITSRTTSDWIRSECEEDQFYKFLVAWGYAMYKHPDNKGNFPKYVESKMIEKGLEMW
jgi:hypothetical protein